MNALGKLMGLCAAAALVAGAILGCALFGGGSGNNLIANGDAEAAVGSSDGAPVNTPSWSVAGEGTSMQYGKAGFPYSTDPGPKNRGKNFFFGGSVAQSSLAQIIDLSSDASAIDAGGVTYNLSGWLGGYSSQNDAASLTITFQDASSNSLGSDSIGPVTAADRNNATALLERSASGSVPAGTRKVAVVLLMIRTDGNANDGYADNLSLELQGT